MVEYGGELTLYRRGMHEPEPIAAPPLPEGARSGPEAFLGAIMRDEPITGPSSPLRGRDIQEVVEAGFQAIRTGRKVSLPLPPGAGGGA